MLFITHSFMDLLGDLESFLEVFNLCFQIRSLDCSVIHILQWKGGSLESSHQACNQREASGESPRNFQKHMYLFGTAIRYIILPPPKISAAYGPASHHYLCFDPTPVPWLKCSDSASTHDLEAGCLRFVCIKVKGVRKEGVEVNPHP